MKKIKPVFSVAEDNDNQERFEKQISDTNYEDAIRICRQSNDEKGHSKTVSFRTIPYYFRLADEIRNKEPHCKTLSDTFRTALNLGFKDILQALKQKKKIGDELDDVILTIDRLEEELKADEIYRRWGKVLKDIPRKVSVYKNDKATFRKQLERYEREIQSLRDGFWRDWLMKKFKLMVRALQSGSEVYDEDEQGSYFGTVED